MKVRIDTQHEVPTDVRFYGRVANAWKQSASVVARKEFAPLIDLELERLAASPHSDECQIRRREFVDRVEFSIKFHHEKIVAHQGKGLGSYLFGILFRERHETPDPRRQRIRRGSKPRMV